MTEIEARVVGSQTAGEIHPLSPLTKAYRKPLSLSASQVLNQGLLHLVLGFFAVLSIAPFIWMIFASFKRFKELVESSDLLPHVWTLDNYSEIVTRTHFFDAMRNTVIASVSVTVSVAITSALCGYVFAKYRFPGKQLLFSILLSTMMIPFAIVLIPLYILIADIGLYDQLAGIILPGMWSTFGIFLMRQFMETIPVELLDAARIDGAGEWRIFGQIVLPLCGAPLVALSILTFLGSWDNFLWPSLILNSPEHQTIPLLLAGLRYLWGIRYDLWMAATMLTVLPLMTLYVIGSKQFIRGIAMTGIKG